MAFKEEHILLLRLYPLFKNKTKKIKKKIKKKKTSLKNYDLKNLKTWEKEYTCSPRFDLHFIYVFELSNSTILSLKFGFGSDHWFV